jgi:hypothetical protein
MTERGTPGLPLAELLAGRDGGQVERYRAVLGLAAEALIVGVAWATVDVERTMQELGRSPGPFAADDPLGARGVVIDDDGVPATLILEPVTEGRLAACLARHGEGICALYVESSEPPAQSSMTGLGRDGGVRSGSPRFGPFVVDAGPARPDGTPDRLGR